MIRGLTIILALLAQPVLGLSCLPPSVEQMYSNAEASEDAYIGVLGVISPLEDFKEPDKTRLQQPKDTVFAAQFSGHSFTFSGGLQDLKTKTKVVLQCAGPWCAQLGKDTNYLTFINMSQPTPTIEIGPCYGNAISDPTLKQIVAMRRCFIDKGCEPTDR